MTAPSVTQYRFRSWPFPLIVGVLSGMFYARSQELTVPETIIGGLVVAAIGGGCVWWFKHPALVHRYTPLIGRWLQISPPASAMWNNPQVVNRDVLLPITNKGGAMQFWATVDRVEGIQEQDPGLFTVRWREQDGERCEISQQETRLLHLARVEPEGDIEKYPLAVGGATKRSVEIQRNWKPVRVCFMGVREQEYAVFLDLSDLPWPKRTMGPERYQRRVRATVRLRSADGAVNETRTVALGVRQVGDSRHSHGAKDAIVAEIEDMR